MFKGPRRTSSSSSDKRLSSSSSAIDDIDRDDVVPGVRSPTPPLPLSGKYDDNHVDEDNADDVDDDDDDED